jgi:hypothetical protein
MRIARRRYRRPFDVRAGLRGLGDAEASVTPSSFGEGSAPVGPVSVTPTGFGEASEPSISAASLVSATSPTVSASQESTALFAPAALQTSAAIQSPASAALKVPTPEEIAAQLNLSAADAAQLEALQAAQAALIQASRDSLVAQWKNSGGANPDRFGHVAPMPAAYANFDPLHAGSSITGPNPYAIINLSNTRFITPGNLEQNNAAKAAVSARDNYFAILNSVAPAIRTEAAGGGIPFLYAGPGTSAGASLHDQLTQQFDANAAKIPGLVSPDYYARQVFNEHYSAINQGYTEGSNLTAIQYEIADRFYNQPALIAARGTQLNIMGSPAVQEAIAHGAALATDRWRATQDGDFEEIVGSTPEEFSAFYHEMPMLAQVAFNTASSGYIGYAVTAIDVLSDNSYQYHKDINSGNVVSTVVPTKINTQTIVQTAANIASQSDSGEGGGMDEGNGGDGDFSGSSADSSFSDTNNIENTPGIDISGSADEFINAGNDFISSPAFEVSAPTAPTDYFPLESSPDSQALFSPNEYVGDLDTSAPPMPPAMPEDNPYGEAMPPAYSMPAAIPETPEQLQQWGMKQTAPGVWEQATNAAPSDLMNRLETALYKTADGLLMKYILQRASGGSSSSIFAPTTVAGSAPAGSRIVNLPPGTTLAPIPVVPGTQTPRSQLAVVIRGGAGILKQAGLQIGKIADTVSANPLLGVAFLSAVYLGARRARSSRRAA